MEQNLFVDLFILISLSLYIYIYINMSTKKVFVSYMIEDNSC